MNTAPDSGGKVNRETRRKPDKDATKGLVTKAKGSQPCPMTLCFQSDLEDLDHTVVLAMVKVRLKGQEGLKVTRLQYVPRIVTYGKSKDLWLITVNTDAAKRELLRGLYHNGKHLTIRKYAEVVAEMTRHQERLQAVSKMMQSIGMSAEVKGSDALGEMLVREARGEDRQAPV